MVNPTHDEFLSFLDELFATIGGDNDNPLYAKALTFLPVIEMASDDAVRLEWIAANMRSLWGGHDRKYRADRGDYRLPDIGLVESAKTHCEVADLRAAIDEQRENQSG